MAACNGVTYESTSYFLKAALEGSSAPGSLLAPPTVRVPRWRSRRRSKCSIVAEIRRGGRSAGLAMGQSGAGGERSKASGEMVFEPILEEGVFRFDCSVRDRAKAFPSLSFADPNVRETPIAVRRVPQYVPTFERRKDQQTVMIQFPSGTSFYGTGEVSGQLERTGKRIFTWNTDAWGFGPETTSLYQSHPWVLAVLPDGKALGVLADTTRRCEIDLRMASFMKFVAAGVYPVITFGPFDSPTEVMMSLSHAIGTVFMPPKWSLGYHQCRWSYESDEKVLEITRKFREKGIPCDVIWMDIDYMDGFRCFTFDKENFSDPISMVNNLHERGFKAIWMLDPGIKSEEGYFIYDSGSKSDVWIKRADGKPFVGGVWPGPCVFPDFTQERTRLWWAKLVKDFMSNGVDGIWNDMNEPAVFRTVTKTMPESNIHSGDSNLGGCQNHSHYHNVYGMLMARSTYEGMKMANSNKRPFVLTRAGFIGSQRYAATWTGDNLSNWEHLHMSLPMILQLGLSGQPLSGPDIGGFAGNATPKLFGRWMGLAALFPFCRGHSEKKTADHEPWSFGEECEKVCRLALLRRYQLLPHLYTLFYMAHTKGTLVASPIFFADPEDENLRKVENSFLLGPLLISASTVPNKSSHECPKVLPKGTWLRFDFGDSHPDLPSMYLQGGSIIPVGCPIQHVGEANPTDELSLFIALDEHGKAVGVLYEDDGDGYGYTQGDYLLTYYSAEVNSSLVNLKILKSEGSRVRPQRALYVKLLLGGGAMILADPKQLDSHLIIVVWYRNQVDARGVDGEELQVRIPSESDLSKLVSASENQYNKYMESAKQIPDDDVLSERKGIDLSKMPIELKRGDWVLKVVPWIGGRITSMVHLPSGTQWLHSRVDIDGYEEYSGTEYRSAGCSEEYKVVRDIEQSGEKESFCMEGDIGGGLVILRQIHIAEGDSKVLRIDSSIIAQSVGAGSGGFSRLVCLRIHPTFTLLHPTDVHVAFNSIDGLKHKILPEANDLSFEGNDRPNGEWMLIDRCAGLALVNRFDPHQIKRCTVHWGTGTVNLELWSEERPVSKDTPLRICHEYECEKVCRLALLRRYQLLPHLYTLFYMAHTKGTLVASPIFFADPEDENLRKVENSFLLGPLLISASTVPNKSSHECPKVLPKGTWLRFDFGDSHPDLPSMYLQGGSIIPVGCPIQHVGEANPTDELSLFIALDEHGKAVGVLYEDDGDGYGYTQGDYLLTYYSAEVNSSLVNLKILKSEGSRVRPQRALYVKLLLGGGAMILADPKQLDSHLIIVVWYRNQVDARGVDGEELQVRIPSESDLSKLVSASENQYNKYMESAKQIPDDDVLSERKGIDLSKMPIELKRGDWVLKVVPWIGGRITSMVHLPSGTQWLHSRVDIDGYEEYSGTEYRSAGCSEEYKVVRDIEQSGEKESFCMEGDIGGGLVILRQIHIAEGDSKVLRIDSSIIAQSVGAGSGGFSRLVCLRIHPTFTLLHPTDVHVAFNSIDGLKHEILPEANDLSFEGNDRPNGEWMLIDRCAGLALANRFDLHQIKRCRVHWGTGTVNLELWSEERPVSKDSPLRICHEYEVRQVS